LPDTLKISPNMFSYKLWLKFFAADFVLLSGNYHIPADATLASVVRSTLTKPTAEEKTITILPGWNIYDIDAYLSEQ